MFVTESVTNGNIQFGPIETLELQQIPLENISHPVAVDYDPVEGKVYWTDVVEKTINRAFVNGTKQEVIVQLSFLEGKCFFILFIYPQIVVVDSGVKFLSHWKVCSCRIKHSFGKQVSLV